MDRRNEQAVSIEILIEARARDIGGFEVRRMLPDARRRSVGPFVFFDQMGPAVLAPGQGMDVRPHPHIGLATVTWLFDGALEHRDSLGSLQVIRPGDVNWMIAGRGIVHSERTPGHERASGLRVHGIQAWIALPRAQEEIEPAFDHHPAASLPAFVRDGTRYCLIAGSAFERVSPVRIFAPMFYLAAAAPSGSRIEVPDGFVERALHVASGSVLLGDNTLRAGQMAVIAPGAGVPCVAVDDAQVMLLGGAPLDGPRTLWWNFVSSRPERIEAAKADWAAGRFDAVPGETESIPLPDR
jgi:redox-sensitive bicupin YhaK (pirin superfamily)